VNSTEGEATLAADAKGHHYDATSIQVLEGLEAVRKRPAMYIGDIGVRGLHHLVYEVVDNSVDEALAGFCTEIAVTLQTDGSVSVHDNGRGIPVDMHTATQKPALEVVMTTLHAGGKFDNKTYRVSGGLHGVGVSVVNALSEWCEVEVLKEGKIYRQRYEHGKPSGAMTSGPATGESSTRESGTTTRFKPDSGIFEETSFHWDTLAARLRELAFLNSGLSITLNDERAKKNATYLYKGGIVEFVKYLNQNKELLHARPVSFAMCLASIGVNVGNLFKIYPEWLKIDPVGAPVPAGTAVFHNGLTAHGAGANMTNRPRRAMTCAYMPDGSTFNGQQNVLPDAYFKSLKIGDLLNDEQNNRLIWHKNGLPQ